MHQSNKVVEAMGKATVYCIMHTERCVAQVSTAGECKIYFEDFMPYGLVLKESNDFDTRINNVISFHSWCASRLILRDRTYAKEILNSIGASQSVTDRERAQIALSYHCLYLLDVFWVSEVCVCDSNKHPSGMFEQQNRLPGNPKSHDVEFFVSIKDSNGIHVKSP